MIIPFDDDRSEPGVHGYLHVPERPSGMGIVLAHGAGLDCQAKLLVEMSNALAAAGFSVLRFDLPFRRARPHGPPSPGTAARDREGLRRAVSLMREKNRGQIFMGGHSYGGRQASMLAAEEPQLVDGVLLLSYPLHPPRKTNELRTAHFPKLGTPAFFVHGTRDSFGTSEELQAALELIPASHTIMEIKGVGHELLPRKDGGEVPTEIVKEFVMFLKNSGRRGEPPVAR